MLQQVQITSDRYWGQKMIHFMLSHPSHGTSLPLLLPQLIHRPTRMPDCLQNVLIHQSITIQLNSTHQWQKHSSKPFQPWFSLQPASPFLFGSLESTYKPQVPLTSVPLCANCTCVEVNLSLSPALFRLFQFIYFLGLNLYSHSIFLMELMLFWIVYRMCGF